MKVVRIEHPISTKGPFNHKFDGKTMDPKGLKRLNKRHCRKMSNPFEEGLVTYGSDFRCAYISLSVMYEFITKKELSLLVNKWGFRVSIIEVMIFSKGLYQVTFEPKHVISKYDITEVVVTEESCEDINF